MLLLLQCGAVGEIPYVGTDQPVLRDQLIEGASDLELYAKGNRSVDHCLCDELASDDDDTHDPEYLYESTVIDALADTKGYAPGMFDDAYTRDDMTGVPTDTLTMWGKIGAICACIVGIALAATTLLFLIKSIRRWRNNSRYQPVEDDATDINSLEMDGLF